MYSNVIDPQDMNMTDNIAVVRAIATDRKRPQFILAMDTTYFLGLNADNFPVNGINIYPMSRFLYQAQPHLAIRERESLEKNAAYRQLLPYVIVKYPNCSDGKVRYATYKRTEGGNEGLLHNKYSIGYGGHIDACDVIYARVDPTNAKEVPSVLDLHCTLMGAAKRECREEFRAADPELQASLDTTGLSYAHKFIVSDRGVDNVHLAIIIELLLPETLLITSKGTVSEAEHEDAGILTAEEALAVDGEMESWSKLYLESEMNRY